ncbi:selina-4(15),7(11)-diene synthase [Streptomyces roseus]|uniref:Terpene synthase n=1 Tax=Streptomyces roseus TaxID=66430 RepID=A0A0J7AAC5_9ACTN|nr:selina-4(15),7(11)-diene synthase [Streptomyces roseus]KMO94246.1 terpene synthase [Streptomyces roseus]
MAVPPLYSPIETAIHPCHAEINAQTADWAETFEIGSVDLRRRLVRHEIGVFAARILPHGREEVVRVVADFVMWLFGVDDGYCEEGPLGQRPGDLAGTMHRLLRVAQNPEAPLLLDDPLANGLRDLRARVDLYGTDSQAARWVANLREYALSVVWEASHRRANTVPALSDYTLMRLYDGATTVIFPLLEMGHGYELPLSERDDKAVRAAEEMASFVITWDNDILSDHKERSADGYHLNVLRVLEEEGLGPQEAMARAIAQRDRVLGAFMHLTDHLRTVGSQQMRQYTAGLRSFVRGSLDWGVTSVRYTTPEDPADLPTAFAARPTDDSCEPLGIDAVSWWWDVVPAGRPLRAARTLGLSGMRG